MAPYLIPDRDKSKPQRKTNSIIQQWARTGSRVKAGLINIRSVVSFNPLSSFMYEIWNIKKTDKPGVSFDVLWSLNSSLTSRGILCMINSPKGFFFFTGRAYIVTHFSISQLKSSSGWTSWTASAARGRPTGRRPLRDRRGSAWGRWEEFTPPQASTPPEKKQVEPAARKKTRVNKNASGGQMSCEKKACDSASEEPCDVQRGDHSGPWHLKTASPIPESSPALLQIRKQILMRGEKKWMRTNACGCDVGFGCVSEKHTICTCHWVDNPEICRIKVNLSLKNEMDSEHIKTQYLPLSMFVVLPMQHILSKGESRDDLLESPDAKPVWIIFFFFFGAQYILFHLSFHGPFFCTIESGPL